MKFPKLTFQRDEVQIDFTKEIAPRPAKRKAGSMQTNILLLLTFAGLGTMASLALHKDAEFRRSEILQSYHQGYEMAKDASYRKILKGENVAGYTRLIAQMNREETCMDKLGSSLTEESAKACLQ
ncbi:hypothetical protein AWB71_05264 [Caballeronia peredens]|nr:hypothetical protein AWB71_05264 [Caballeronia peredens]